MPPSETWITTGMTLDAMALRGLALVVISVVVIVLALAARDALGQAARTITRDVGRALGAPVRPDWYVSEWLCGACRSTNRNARDRCSSCRTSCTEAELHRVPSTPVETLPTVIAVPAGAHVRLDHEAGAHRDGLNGHWRLRVNGQIIGTASRRAGALALLRAVDGAEVIQFDPTGSGYERYMLRDVIAAFEGPRFPLDIPCPEAALPA